MSQRQQDPLRQGAIDNSPDRAAHERIWRNPNPGPPHHSASDKPEGPSEELYSIKDAARFAGFHPQTLRWYEKRGLIKPMRTPGNARRYSARDIELLLRIKSLSKRGMSLEAMRLVLSLERERQSLYELVEALEREVSRLRSAASTSRVGGKPHHRSPGQRRSYETGPSASGG